MAAPKKEFCIEGHPRDDAHTYIDSSGFAQCIACRNLRSKRYRDKKKAAGFKLIHGRWIKDPARENLLAPTLGEVLYGKKGKKKK